MDEIGKFEVLLIRVFVQTIQCMDELGTNEFYTDEFCNGTFVQTRVCAYGIAPF